MKIITPKAADLFVVFFLASFTLWYGISSWLVSDSAENLILILPVGIIALVLCSIEIINQLLGRSHPIESGQPVKQVLPVISLFTVYILSLEWLGFDVATTLFIAAFLLMQGERRWVWVIGYSICFGMFMSYFFAQMLPYPMPMSIFPTDY